MDKKPEFRINLANGAPTTLRAIPWLTSLDPVIGYHLQQNIRPPLGIYNVSLTRICDKIIKCSQRLEKYFLVTNFDMLSQNMNIRDEAYDYLELVLYASAEHVDDLESIINGFFKTNPDCKRSSAVRNFSKDIKEWKKVISTTTNAIKHTQSRIRPYSIEFHHAARQMCLHGYMIETVKDGVVGARSIFPDIEKRVFSITSLLWEILMFLLRSSQSLERFLIAIKAGGTPDNNAVFSKFQEAVSAVARLPLYSLDEDHPFSATRIIIDVDDLSRENLNSGIYGSIYTKWDKSGEGKIIRTSAEFAGDGITKQFQLTSPKALHVQFWE